uniref:short-chain dehydrogenase reductase 3b-like n=1 Tax=Erigeron canadensis TaxID=72917 RepID=UPI001CB9BFC5|nr:short-chain dehydrogenase reductase 3b-like [Erigeron canadensis]
MMNKLRLEGKVALITGGASGIGEATAKLFIENGANVVIADIQDDLANQVIASCEISSHPGKICYFPCDVRDEKQVEAAVSHAVTKYGTIDILFSNAGIMGPMTTFLDMDLDAFDNTIAVNVRGVAATIKHVARSMVAKKTRGSIICTASVAASIGGAGPHAYTASKHAIIGLMRTACYELGAYGIRVNCVSPFGVGTPLSCTAFNLEPSQVEQNCCESGNLKGVVLKAKHVAEATLFLASDESVYVSGQNLGVDGGYTVVSRSYSVTSSN